jgi:hypothetical protein
MRRKAPFFVILILLLSLFFSPVAFAQVQVRIRVIKASNVGQTIDPSLRDLYSDLGSLFNFTSYQLLGDNSFNLSPNQPVSTSPRPGILMEVTLVGQHRPVAELIIRVVRKGREILNTQVRLSPRRTVLIGGPKLREGVIIYAIAANF